MEQWEYINGCNNRYKISNEGQVHNLTGHGPLKLKQYRNSRDNRVYVHLKLTPQDSYKRYYVSDLIAAHFSVAQELYEPSSRVAVLPYDPALEVVVADFEYENVIIVMKDGKRRVMEKPEYEIHL